jgi:hypothetical protein
MNEEEVKPCDHVPPLDFCGKCEVDYSQIMDALNQRIKELESTIDALLKQNQMQMEELEKLEAWQKEAVRVMQVMLFRVAWKEEQRHIEKLIKQAEAE